MNKRSVFQGLLIALFCLTMANSYSQIYFPVKGTACAIWDDANNRYLYTYQDITKEAPPKTGPVYNAATIYECNRQGTNEKIFTQLAGQMKAPTALAIVGNNLYIADNYIIWVASLTDGSMVQMIIAPGLMVQGLATDGVNMLWTTDYADSKIYWIDLNTMAWDTLACDTNGLKQPSGIYYEETPKKSLFVCSFIPNSPIQRYDFSGDSLYTIKRTTYRFCYGITGDGKGNYYMSDWRSTAVNAGAVYLFSGGFDNASTYVDYLNFPAIPCVRPSGDTLVITELNNSKSKLRLVPTNRDLVPPLVDTVLVANKNTLLVHFNEPVNATATLPPLNTKYQGVGTIASATLDATKMIVTVVLVTPLTIDLTYKFTVQKTIQDLIGNAMHQARTIDIVYKIQSIHDDYLNGGLAVYPNPVRNKLNINYELKQPVAVNIELYDIMGKRVAEFYNGNQAPGEYNDSYQLPNSIAGNGMYILKLTISGQIIMSKIMVNR